MDVIKKVGAALRTFFLDSNGKNVINVIERALWTFVESFLLSMPCVESLGVDGYKWKCALFGAACAAFSAVKTVIIEIVRSRLDSLKEAADDGKDD